MVINGRKPKNGPEADLLNLALSCGFLGNKNENVVIFREPNLPTGFPDLVQVYQRNYSPNFNQIRAKLSSWHIRLLHFIYQFGGIYLHEIPLFSLYPAEKIKKLVNELHEADMVYFRGRKVFPVSIRRIFTARRIVAIEAKINDWRKAVRQAIANKWFSSHSYILLPERANMKKILNEAQSFGVGVMVFNGEKTKELCQPKSEKLPNSYGSWLLNEWAMRNIRHDQ